MPSSSNNSGLRDNHTRGTVADFLRAKSRIGSKLSIVSAYFTIYAFDALKEELEGIEHLDFLFGEPSFVNRLDPNKTEKKAFIIDADGLELSNRLQQKRVARECADWIECKVDIKSIKQSNLPRRYLPQARCLRPPIRARLRPAQCPRTDPRKNRPELVTWLVIKEDK